MTAWAKSISQDQNEKHFEKRSAKSIAVPFLSLFPHAQFVIRSPPPPPTQPHSLGLARPSARRACPAPPPPHSSALPCPLHRTTPRRLDARIMTYWACRPAEKDCSLETRHTALDCAHSLLAATTVISTTFPAFAFVNSFAIAVMHLPHPPARSRGCG